MRRLAALQIPILFLAAACGRNGLGVPASQDGGLVSDTPADLATDSADAPGVVYRQSTQKFVQVSAGGGQETCGLRADGSMLCWGYFGDFPESSAFGSAYVPRPPAEGWKQVSPASGATCGIKNDDALVCWGVPRSTNLEPPAGRYLAVDARGPCAIRLSDGGIVCWGSAEDWGNTVPDGRFKQLSIWDAACALKEDDTAVCWGHSRIMAAMGATPDGAFLQVVSGGLFACGLRRDGQLVCWGSTKDWLGSDPRVARQPEGAFVQIAAGAGAACGVRTDGSLACWGMVWGTAPPEGSYLQVTVGYSYDAVPLYFCALRTDGTVVCWGGNSDGESSPP
jgi:hypothetical protein